jgi:2-dehydro-3-deoxy-D-arabinonate dehydratase
MPQSLADQGPLGQCIFQLALGEATGWLVVMLKIYRLSSAVVTDHDGEHRWHRAFSFDAIFMAPDPVSAALDYHLEGDLDLAELDLSHCHAPIGSQEVWAAGVTYKRSKAARMEEAEESGGDRFYDLVYEAERPELFFKATALRARGHGEKVRIRRDSTWDVPEPELTLAINMDGKVFGYTVGNDMSSRSIEGENPLYLPQAKVYRGSCAIGPCLVIGREAVSPETKITLTIERDGGGVFGGATKVDQLKRSFDELAEFLYRENEFPHGAYLMTGTGVVPDSSFTLKSGDRLKIEIDGIGVLENEVE